MILNLAIKHKDQKTFQVPLPLKTIQICYIIYLSLSLVLKIANCEDLRLSLRQDDEPEINHFREYIEPTPGYDQRSDLSQSNSWNPTPPLDLNFAIPLNRNDNTSWTIEEEAIEKPNAYKLNILPTKVLSNYIYTNNDNDNLFSPIFKLQSSINPNILIYNHQQQQQPATENNSLDIKSESNSESINSFQDLIEPGSGAGNWDGNSFEDSTNILEDSTSLIDNGATAIQATPRLTPEFGHQATVNLGDRYDRGPVLQRRLPKLVATAGQVWKFYIPPETFVDEDGDLRQLKSSIVPTIATISHSNKIDQGPYNETERDSIGQYNSWLQYDQANQLVYGFPTENEVGVHEYLLVVADRWGMVNNETLEIHVRQHQSTRAFTHLVVMNRVEWNVQKYSSFVDALGEFVRRVTSHAFGDQPFRNFIAQYYVIDSSQNATDSNGGNSLVATTSGQQAASSSFTIAWSNSSIPVHPCKLSYIDHLSRTLMDVQKRIQNGPNEPATFEPSRNLIQALDYEFKPTSISIFLQAACENRENLQTNKIQDDQLNNDGLLRTRTKIGKLTYKLGEPIEFRIPAETFESSGKVSITRELLLSVHTIDGKTLDADLRYNYLEFDQESQTLYGLAYDFVDHTSQREIQLTGRHPKSDQKVREVFIIDVEAPDLTTINNRAFRMSLYVGTRTGLFGPKMRVNLSHRMSSALHFGEDGYRNTQEKPEFIVVDIQKFAFGSQFDARGNDLYSKDSGGITRVADNSSYLPDDLLETQDAFTDHTTYSRTNYLYKYIWTDSTIGHRGDCPEEVIKESILYSLERSMLEYRFTDGLQVDDSNKNDSVKFYNRLRRYFEPELDLIHLRFEPMNACYRSLELHDIGNSELADQVDKTDDIAQENEQDLAPLNIPPKALDSKTATEINSDEYWSIIVLIVLVVALIFVILMFVMGMHTYRINQDKRLELQVRLAQARQNSMFLSSMVLADHTTANDINASMLQPPAAKSMYVIQDEDKAARKPVILDNEKQILVGGNGGGALALEMQKPSAVQMNGNAIQTTTMRPNMTFTLDSIASWQQQPHMVIPNYPQPILMQAYPGDQQHRSMTLHRQPTSTAANVITQQSAANQPIANGGLNHSQSILTVGSISTPMQSLHQASIPLVAYGPMPFLGGDQSFQQNMNNFASLPRRMSQQKMDQHTPSIASNGPILFNGNNVNFFKSANDSGSRNKINSVQSSGSPKLNGRQNGIGNKLRSPSYSSSNSETPQSIISNPNYNPS